MSAFDDATATREAGPGLFDWLVPDGWQQGRGAWGGLVVGALVASVVSSEPDPTRTVRSVSVQLFAPALVGPHVIAVKPVRRGGAMSTWSARLARIDGEPVASMVAILGSPRVADADDHGEWGVAVPPRLPDRADILRAPGGSPLPVFTQHVEIRPVSGFPMAGGPAETAGWVAFADPPTPSAASMLALVDAWWPASLPRLSSMPRIATVNFMANLLVDPKSVEASDALVSHSLVTAAREGFTSEHRQLWTADGRLAVDNMQSLVVGS